MKAVLEARGRPERGVGVKSADEVRALRAKRRELEWADRELREMREVLEVLGEATDLAIEGLREEEGEGK